MLNMNKNFGELNVGNYESDRKRLNPDVFHIE